MPIYQEQQITTSDICNCCGNTVTENYCTHCGQAAKLTAIDKHYITHELFHLLHFERGFFYTAKALMIKPGSSIKVFLRENRAKHMKPIAYLILNSLLFTFIAHIFHADAIYDERDKLVFGKSSIGTILNWIQSHYGYSNLLSVFFSGLCVHWLFKKYGYNFFEICIVVCYVVAQGMLIGTFITFFAPLIGKQNYINALLLTSFVYPTWVFGQFFDRKKILSYVKAFLAYFFGYILFYIAIILVGLSVDLLLSVF